MTSFYLVTIPTRCGVVCGKDTGNAAVLSDPKVQACCYCLKQGLVSQLGPTLATLATP